MLAIFLFELYNLVFAIIVPLWTIYLKDKILPILTIISFVVTYFYLCELYEDQIGSKRRTVYGPTRRSIEFAMKESQNKNHYANKNCELQFSNCFEMKNYEKTGAIGDHDTAIEKSNSHEKLPLESTVQLNIPSPRQKDRRIQFKLKARNESKTSTRETLETKKFNSYNSNET